MVTELIETNAAWKEKIESLYWISGGNTATLS